MTTGAEFPNFTNKRLMSFQDFAARTVGYLQELNREVTEIQFSQGAFSEKLPMDSPGVNQVRLNVKPTVGDFKVHDGNGHLLDLQNDNVALFENTAAITYEVGAGRIDQPVEIAINPRTGKPDYDRYVEAVGDEAEPNSVTDNGANITFRVDSLIANGGESLAGRTVRVFKKIPADDATTEAVAIEELTVSFGGGQNTITTAGLLGQATVSTTASDYLVQLVGLSVRRTTNPAPISASASHFFAGTVLGNGGTPVTFDITNQFIIQADTASDINFVPYTGAAPISWEIAASNVQAAIEEIVDDLTVVGAGAGAYRVGADTTFFTQSAPSATVAWGGLGTAGINAANDALTAANNRIAAARFAITHATATGRGDFLNDVDQIVTPFQNETHELKGPGDHVLTNANSDMNQDAIPTVIGESPLKTRLSPPGTVGNYSMYGRFQNMTLFAQNLADFGTEGVAHLENCVISPNNWTAQVGNYDAVASGALDKFQPVSLRSCYMPPSVSGATPTSTYGFRVFRNSTNRAGVVLIENCVFNRGDIATDGPLVLVQGPADTSDPQGARAEIVFQNCFFWGADFNQDVIELDEAFDVTFIGCVIANDETGEGWCVRFTGGGNNTGSVNCRFIGCDLWTAGGNMVTGSGYNTSSLRPSGNSCSFRDCRFAGANTHRTGNTRQILATSYVDYLNCNFSINASHMQIASAVPNQPMVEVFNCIVDGCYFGYQTYVGITQCHAWTNLFFGGCKVDNCFMQIPDRIHVGLGAGTQAWFWFSDCTGSGNTFDGDMNSSTTQSENEWNHVRLDDSQLENCNFLINVGSLGTAGNPGCIFLTGEASAIRGWRIYTADTNNRYSMKADFGFIHLDGNLHEVQDCVFGYNGSTPFEINSASPSDSIIQIDGSMCKVKGNRGPYPSGGLDSLAETTFCRIFSGSGHHIDDNIWSHDQAVGTGGFFIVNDGTGDNITCKNNKFYREQGTNNPANTQWINLTNGGGGTHCIVQGNTLWNGQATLPAIQVGASSLTADGTTNILVNSTATPV